MRIELNSKTFIEYWEAISNELYSYLIRRTNKNDTEDIFQDIAQLAFTKFHLFQVPDKEYIDFKCWVYGVAANKIKKWRSKQLFLSYFHMGQYKDISNMDDLVDILINAEHKDLLKSSIANLPIYDKKLIYLRNYKELSYEDIAMILGKSKSALMTQHTRTLKKLYRMMIYYENDI